MNRKQQAWVLIGFIALVAISAWAFRGYDTPMLLINLLNFRYCG